MLLPCSNFDELMASAVICIALLAVPGSRVELALTMLPTFAGPSTSIGYASSQASCRRSLQRRYAMPSPRPRQPAPSICCTFIVPANIGLDVLSL